MSNASRVALKGQVAKGIGWATDNWPRMLAAHADLFPEIRGFVQGTFNIRLTDPPRWNPPRDEWFRAEARRRGLLLGQDKNRGGDFLAGGGNYIHPGIRVARINDRDTGGLVYYAGPEVAKWQWAPGGMPLPVARERIEILSPVHLRTLLGLGGEDHGSEVVVELLVQG